MDALSFLKFWRLVPTESSPLNTDSIKAGPHLVLETDSESDEEDSFFDIELSFSALDNKENNNGINNIANSQAKGVRDKYRHDCLLDEPGKIAKGAGNGGRTCLKPNLSASDSTFKWKVHPIELSSKPQSPTALLKSAPSFRVLMFKKPKVVATEKTESKVENQNQKQSKIPTVELRLEGFRTSHFLSRANSTTSMRNNGTQNHVSEGPKSERMSKDIIGKYFKLIKPLYVKVSKRCSDKIKVSKEVSMASPSSSPAIGSFPSPKKEKQGIPAGIKVVCKHLGKSKSTSAAVGVASPVNKRDDTLLQQYDGIQSAILHCKNSFNSYSESSLSRSARDPYAEKSFNSLKNSFEGVHRIAAI